jgi:hypothetical protein
MNPDRNVMFISTPRENFEILEAIQKVSDPANDLCSTADGSATGIIRTAYSVLRLEFDRSEVSRMYELPG